jgi:hypothetical protein
VERALEARARLELARRPDQPRGHAAAGAAAAGEAMDVEPAPTASHGAEAKGAQIGRQGQGSTGAGGAEAQPQAARLRFAHMRAADALAGWKGGSLAARLWGAVAHNVAHWEALRRPRAWPALGDGAAATSACGGGAGKAAAAAQPTAAAPGGGGGGGAAGVVGAAHWRAVQALAAAALATGAGVVPPAAVDGAGGRAPASPSGPLLTCLHDSLRWLVLEPAAALDAAADPAGGAGAAAAWGLRLRPAPPVPSVLERCLLPPLQPELATPRLRAAAAAPAAASQPEVSSRRGLRAAPAPAPAAEAAGGGGDEAAGGGRTLPRRALEARPYIRSRGGAAAHASAYVQVGRVSKASMTRSREP